jgi:3D (Asp-Asp-Asp) domain-containing protein
MLVPRILALSLLLVPVACSGPQKWAVEPPRAAPTHAGAVVEDAWGNIDLSPPDVVAPEVPDVAGAPQPILDVGGSDDGSVYRNTYYDFPREGAGDKDATLFTPSCTPIAQVTRRFHDQVCVQGSGRLAMGSTVSFAKRDCACAAVCPRTGQHICFERLDPARFPHGRGATGGPITPLRTVAVDTSVIPLGTLIFVPELAGLPRTDGSPHDGCFIAEDRGLKVVGRHIDVFTGDPSMTVQWNTLMPSNKGVHVRIGDPRCSR